MIPKTALFVAAPSGEADRRAAKPKRPGPIEAGEKGRRASGSWKKNISLRSFRLWVTGPSPSGRPLVVRFPNATLPHNALLSPAPNFAPLLSSRLVWGPE